MENRREDGQYTRLLDRRYAAKVAAASDHAKADQVLLELLEGLGFKETVRQWNRVPKWYA